MLDTTNVRNAIAKFAEPTARFLLRMRITPNMMTATTAVVASVIAFLTWAHGSWGAGLLIGLPFILGDMLDGTMARISGRVTAFGSFLDSVMDRVTDAAILGSLTYWFATAGNFGAMTAGLIAMTGTAVVPYARAKAESLQVNGKGGLMERGDRLLLLAICAVLSAIGIDMMMAFAMYALATLTALTVLQRMRMVYIELRDVA